MCLQALTQLEDYIKKHGASNPLTLQIISTNIGYFCNADRNLVLHPRISVYDAYHFAKPAPNKYDYRSMNMKQMSGNVTTPIVALAHYLWGNGAERSVNISNIGLKISPMKINQIKDIIKSGVVGNITLKTEGTLTISANDSRTYNGVVRSYDDKYDFNASTHRGVIGESLTRLGAMFSGKEYQILLPGEIHIKESGKR